MLDIFNKRNKINLFIICVYLCVAFFSSFFLFRTHTLFGPFDLDFHIRRIFELEESFNNGHIIPSFSFNGFHGTASLLMYPSFNLLLIVLGHMFIKSNITLLYLFIDENVFISLISSYYSSLKFSDSKLTSFLFSVIYSVSSSFLFISFYNMDLGALTAVSILPLSIFGYLDFIRNNNCLKFIIGTSIMIYSHVLSTIILFMFIFIYSLINLSKFNGQKYYKLAKSILVLMSLTSIVWIPMLYLEFNNLGNIFPPFLGTLHGISFVTLFKDSIISHITSPYLNVFAIIGLFLSIFFYKLLNYYDRQFYWISLFIVFVCSNIFPWSVTNHGLFKVFRIFQFPWRFYIIPEVLLCYLFSKCITKCISNRAIKITLVVLSLVLVSLLSVIGQNHYVNNKFPQISSSYLLNRTYDSNLTIPLHNKSIHTHIREVHFFCKYGIPKYKISNNKELKEFAHCYSNILSMDYYPKGAISKQSNINNNKGIDEHENLIPVKHIGFNKFSFHNNHGIKRLSLPLVLYNAEKLHIYVNRHLIHYYSKNNLITINDINPGKHSLNIKYIPNIYVKMIEILLFIIGLLNVLWICVKYHKNDRKML